MRINYDHNEFLDFIAILLFDLLKHDELLDENPRFNELRAKLNSRGITQTLFKYYLEAPAESRKEYKQKFKPVLMSSSKTATLFIFPFFEQLVKEVAEIVAGKELNEKKISRIISRLNEDETV
jgi:hypothetical protein